MVKFYVEYISYTYDYICIYKDSRPRLYDIHNWQQVNLSRLLQCTAPLDKVK